MKQVSTRFQKRIYILFNKLLFGEKMRPIFGLLILLSILIIGICAVSASGDTDTLNVEKNVHTLSSDDGQGSFEILTSFRDNGRITILVCLKDPNGQPCSDKDVEIHYGEKSSRRSTDSEGVALFVVEDNGEHEFLFHYEGYDFEATQSFYIE